MEQTERPWSVRVTVADIPDDGRHIELAADDMARAVIAKVAGLRALPQLEASFDLARRGEAVAVRGEVRALAGQTCVLTLEPIENPVRETVDLVFAPAAAEEGTKSKKKGDPPEQLENGVIDLGAVATEFLILGLDPYPRKPNAEFASPQPSGENDGARPFATLSALKKRP
jgi:uncharacterized metal-binding protein YceD (DUF177 family)